MVHTEQITVETEQANQMIDLTGQVNTAINRAKMQNGIATVFVQHTTAAVTISEIEPGLIADIHLPMERIAPASGEYRHNKLNADDNAHSHLLSTVISPSLTVPFQNSRLMLGTWQSLVLIELDSHPRRRNIVIQMLGE